MMVLKLSSKQINLYLLLGYNIFFNKHYKDIFTYDSIQTYSFRTQQKKKKYNFFLENLIII